MTLEQALDNRRIGKTWRAHSWRTVCYYDEDNRMTVELWHHATMMLKWHPPLRSYHPVGITNVVHIDRGHGSKSDQGGMNRAFRHLGLPYFYSRKGGPMIIDLRHGLIDYSHKLPPYLRDPEIRRRVYGYTA